MPTPKALLTNRDVKESPFGDLCSVRDRVRESAEPIIMSNAIDYLSQQATHFPGCKTFEQDFTYSLKLMSSM
jgi:hypothetical protein